MRRLWPDRKGTHHKYLRVRDQVPERPEGRHQMPAQSSPLAHLAPTFHRDGGLTMFRIPQTNTLNPRVFYEGVMHGNHRSDEPHRAERVRQQMAACELGSTISALWKVHSGYACRL